MPRQANVSVENNFIKGLVTEATGLNFPENAATDTDNCVFNRIGNVTRRLGIDYEVNHVDTALNPFTGNAISYFKWDNAGGDGNTKILVQQVGGALYFWRSSSATTSLPLSQQRLLSVITLGNFVPVGGSAASLPECQYASGNGYLFVFNSSLDPFYCTYSAGTVTASVITVKIRDFIGIPETFADDFRPPLSNFPNKHTYNLFNQGWVFTAGWTATSATSNNTVIGSKTWTVATGIAAAGPGDPVNITGIVHFSGDPGNYPVTMSGTVTSYTSGTGVLIVDVTSASFQSASFTGTDWTFTAPGVDNIAVFVAAVGAGPSNSDIWWRYKNSTGVFDPTTMKDKVTLDQAPAPKGRFVLDAFNQNRNSLSNFTDLTTISTLQRPKTGTWFQGRLWYAGTDASFPASGDAPNTTWTESIYFSQIIEKVDQFGKCYQVNDPTSELTFDLLPSDGGVIRIQGCGTVFKLYPIQNGMLVFAANGIWFITGSQGIGFTANDYTITKISAVQSLSSTSFVDVQGYPAWWNEEGIYSILPSQQGLQVNSMTFSTISSFYEDIPLTSKKYARGDYNPLDYTIQWVYRGEEESTITSRYQFNRVLNFNVGTQCFYPWTIASSISTPNVNGVVYIVGPGGSTSPAPVFKYLTSYNLNGVEVFNFSEERDTSYLDWETPIVGQDYTSHFVTGYKIHGQAQKKFQPTYVYMFSNNEEDTAYRIQGIWNYANSGDSGKFSVSQLVIVDLDNFDKAFKRHKIRGHGVALQLKVLSVTGEPFDIMGWSIFETISASV